MIYAIYRTYPKKESFVLCVVKKSKDSVGTPLPCRGGVGGGVSIVLTANEVTDPTPAPPIERRGVQQMIYAFKSGTLKMENGHYCGAIVAVWNSKSGTIGANLESRNTISKV